LIFLAVFTSGKSCSEIRNYEYSSFAFVLVSVGCARPSTAAIGISEDVEKGEKRKKNEHCKAQLKVEDFFVGC